MAHHEKEISIKVKYDPDLVKHIKKSTKSYTDDNTGEEIPKGSAYYMMPLRLGPNLVNVRVSEATYASLQTQDV